MATNRYDDELEQRRKKSSGTKKASSTSRAKSSSGTKRTSGASGARSSAGYDVDTFYGDGEVKRKKTSSNGTRPSGTGSRPSGNGTRPSGSGNRTSGARPSGTGTRSDGQRSSGNGQRPSGTRPAGTSASGVTNQKLSRPANLRYDEDDDRYIEAQAPSKKKRKSQKAKKRKRRRTILIIEVVALIIILAMLYFWSKMSQINYTEIGATETNELSEKATDLLKGYENIALFGLDNRQIGNYENGRSDTIMVASINNDTKEVKIVSIYRDTLFDTTGDGDLTKANAAYNKGPESAINMLNRNMDLDITDYVTVDFGAIVEVVDALGGVDIDVSGEEAFWINGYYMPEVEKIVGKSSTEITTDGVQTLDGIQALCYCRIRYTSGGDFERAYRQREVLEQIIAKAKQANVSELNALIDAIFPSIDTSFSAAELISLASAYKDYTLAGTSGFPFDKATGTFDSVGSVDVPCTLESNVKELYEYLYGEEDYEPSEKVLELSLKIKNMTGYTEDNALDYGF